jgi:hypothetical protein
MDFISDYVYDKVPYTWLLYVNSALCALSLVAYIFLAEYYLEVFFAVFLLCKASTDILFTVKTQEKKWWKEKKSYARYHIYIAGIIDLVACVAILFPVFSDIAPVTADLIILLWVILQSIWGSFFTLTDELERKQKLLNGLSAFLLSFSLITFIWAKSSFIFILFSLFVHFMIRLIIASSFREKISEAVKNYRHVSMASGGGPRY